jgi:hypothetical protein
VELRAKSREQEEKPRKSVISKTVTTKARKKENTKNASEK